ncbi:MAG: hypothetical protein WCA91_20020 [Candidatus Acidiferrales bacterium]
MNTQASKTLKLTIAAAAALAWRKAGLAVGVAISTLALSLSAAAHEPIIITFDPLGSQGTFPQCLSDGGAITGYYHDQDNVYHGFLRAPDGQITIFDVPGEGTGPGLGPSPYAINTEGAIAGAYFDANGVSHGFVRFPDGAITTFDVTGQGTGGNYPASINALGEIAGEFIDDNNVSHVFLRAPDGEITTFDVRAAGTEAGQGTYDIATCDGINLEGAIAGNYIDGSNVTHGFVRSPFGAVATFDAPGAGTAAGAPFCGFFIGNCQGTYVTGINLAGAVIGWDNDSNFFAHGFVRARDGTITTFDAPAANNPGPYTGTVPYGISVAGAITGNYNADFFDYGFVRARDGAILSFEAPGAVNTGAYSGTVPISNNSAGMITGSYSDVNGVSHGFLVLPGRGASEATALAAQVNSIPKITPPENVRSLAQQRMTRSRLRAGLTASQ